ncbi:MAG: hypothetical protein ACFB2W_13730 [Leptolyngbyaceae cyanobacterium]
MSTSFVEAVEALRTTLSQLLPTNLSPAVTLDLSVYPHKIKPTGLGGFIASHDTVNGDILGCQVDGDVSVLLQANQFDQLQTDVNILVTHFATLSREQRLENGLLRFRLKPLDKAESRDESGSRVWMQTLRYQTLYEFLKIPTESEEIIQTVPINIQVS